MNLTFDTSQPRGDTLTHDERNNGILSKYQFARHGLDPFRHRHVADDQPRHRFRAYDGNTKSRAAHGLDVGCEGGFHHQILWQEFGTSMPILDLKLPPSVNLLWRTGRSKVFRSSTYDAWRKEAGWELQAQRLGLVEGAVEVSIALGRPDNRKRDLDNAPARRSWICWWLTKSSKTTARSCASRPRGTAVSPPAAQSSSWSPPWLRRLCVLHDICRTTKIERRPKLAGWGKGQHLFLRRG